MNLLHNRRGTTLAELMIAVAILGVAVLSFFSAFNYISRSLRLSRARILATNLAQEKIESLKNISYYALLVTTSSSVDNTVSPAVVYDNANYPADNISIGGITFIRYTFISLAQVNNDVISAVSYTYPDTGMKQITVNVLWNENGARKQLTLNNLLENPNVDPLDSSFSGSVTSAGGGAFSAAIVKVEQNPDWNTITGASGSYSFRVYHGTYTIRASSAGYYDAVSAVQIANTGSNTSVPALAMIPIASGTIAGVVWVSTNLVISEVMASSITPNGYDVQYVDLYNPTTAPINIGSGASHLIKLNFTSVFQSQTCTDIPLVYVSTYVGPNNYYLIANTNTFVISGTNFTADAYYSDSLGSSCSANPNGWSPPGARPILQYNHSGTVWITNTNGITQDAVGWDNGSSIPNNCETSCIYFSAGFVRGDQIVRVSSPAASMSDVSTYAKAYDSDNNPNDFLYDTVPGFTGILVNPRTTTTGTETLIAGRPMLNASVSSSDPVSGSTKTYAAYITSGTLSLLYAKYALTGVSTGTWTVEIASGSYWREISTASVTSGATTYIPNATTVPTWTIANNFGVSLNSATINGFIDGQVTDINGNPIPNIQIQATGATSKSTNSNGRFFMMVSSGPIVVTANPNSANSLYVQSVSMPTISQGQTTTINFMLSQGGTITGYVTSGTTPLPNIVIAALNGGSQAGAGTSNISGVFMMRGISTGTYTVEPVLDTGQNSSPNSTNVTVSAGGTVSVGTFTVTGAMGNIAGTVTQNGSAVSYGALILASTGTLSSSPPVIYAASAPAMTVLYAISSQSDGTYTLPLRGQATYYLSVYIPTAGTSSVTMSTKSYSGIYVSPGLSTTQNITVP